MYRELIALRIVLLVLVQKNYHEALDRISINAQRYIAQYANNEIMIKWIFPCIVINNWKQLWLCKKLIEMTTLWTTWRWWINIFIQLRKVYTIKIFYFFFFVTFSTGRIKWFFWRKAVSDTRIEHDNIKWFNQKNVRCLKGCKMWKEISIKLQSINENLNRVLTAIGW